MKRLFAVAVAFVGLAFSAATASAGDTGPGPNGPLWDGLCTTNPAFTAGTPKVTIGSRNRVVVQAPRVGLRAQSTTKCVGAVHPSDYGDGPL